MTSRELRLRERIDTLTSERDHALEQRDDYRRRFRNAQGALREARRGRDRWRVLYESTRAARRLHRTFGRAA